MKCSKKLKEISGHVHGFSLIILFIFTILQIHAYEKNTGKYYWLPIGIVIMVIMHLPNIICIALNDWHGWYVCIASLIALGINSYLIYYTYRYIQMVEYNKDYQKNNIYY
jgi:hypothetical protein